MNGTEIVPVNLSPQAATALVRAEVDMQVTTAKAYPRNIDKVMSRAVAMATQTEEMAGRCLYALTRAGKTIEGPSVRLAEILASCWGNLRAETRIVEEGQRDVTAKATVWDMETNVLISQEVRRRITNKSGVRYNDDMIGTTMNAASSIALRNAMFRVVPRSVVDEVYQRAVDVFKKSASALSDRVSRAMETFGKLGVVQDRVLARVGVASIREVTHDHLAVLAGLLNAIRDGEQDIDDAFPLPEAPAANGKPANPASPAGKMDAAAEALAKKAAELEHPAGPEFEPKATPKVNGKRRARQVEIDDKTLLLDGEELTRLAHAIETSNKLGDQQDAAGYAQEVLGVTGLDSLAQLTRQQAEVVLEALEKS